jgi:hypothetical protein
MLRSKIWLVSGRWAGVFSAEHLYSLTCFNCIVVDMKMASLVCLFSGQVLLYSFIVVRMVLQKLLIAEYFKSFFTHLNVSAVCFWFKMSYAVSD